MIRLKIAALVLAIAVVDICPESSSSSVSFSGVKTGRESKMYTVGTSL